MFLYFFAWIIQNIMAETKINSGMTHLIISISEPSGQTCHSLPALVWPPTRKRPQAWKQGVCSSKPAQCKSDIWWYQRELQQLEGQRGKKSSFPNKTISIRFYYPCRLSSLGSQMILSLPQLTVSERCTLDKLPARCLWKMTFIYIKLYMKKAYYPVKGRKVLIEPVHGICKQKAGVIISNWLLLYPI